MRIGTTCGKVLTGFPCWSLPRRAKSVPYRLMASLKPRCKHTSNDGHSSLHRGTSQCVSCSGSSPLSTLNHRMELSAALNRALSLQSDISQRQQQVDERPRKKKVIGDAVFEGCSKDLVNSFLQGRHDLEVLLTGEDSRSAGFSPSRAVVFL